MKWFNETVGFIIGLGIGFACGFVFCAYGLMEKL